MVSVPSNTLRDISLRLYIGNKVNGLLSSVTLPTEPTIRFSEDKIGLSTRNVGNTTKILSIGDFILSPPPTNIFVYSSMDSNNIEIGVIISTLKHASYRYLYIGEMYRVPFDSLKQLNILVMICR